MKSKNPDLAASLVADSWSLDDQRSVLFTDAKLIDGRHRLASVMAVALRTRSAPSRRASRA
jgi:hypothetical protein